MGTSPCYVAGKIHHFYGPCSISYVKLPEPSCEEEAMQLERDVDKIKLDVQDAVKKAPRIWKIWTGLRVEIHVGIGILSPTSLALPFVEFGAV